MFDLMTISPEPLKVFIGSSAEGLLVAKNLQAELESAEHIEVDRWDTGTFEPGGITLESLVEKARAVDFAILVATGEDTVASRGQVQSAVRDNIVFELGLFIGTIGRERVYLLSVGDVKLPSDLSGVTRLVYRKRRDNNIRAGLNEATLAAHKVMEKLGPRRRVHLSHGSAIGEPVLPDSSIDALSPVPPSFGGSPRAAAREQAQSALEQEISLLCANAVDQGWSVVKRNGTLLRLLSPKGREFTLRRGNQEKTRVELRSFVSNLRANGLRVNHVLQEAAENSPFS